MIEQFPTIEEKREKTPEEVDKEINAIFDLLYDDF